ncbi:hypothetical protein U9M48_006644 [Paspalum notatum var. saurae]|uniref:Uncharacterized protein n=1 Tax=Paspalum notatum var. saurae TaxID=547442 RepID=A0AAQ3Q0A3_PASNO
MLESLFEVHEMEPTENEERAPPGILEEKEMTCESMASTERWSLASTKRMYRLSTHNIGTQPPRAARSLLRSCRVPSCASARPALQPSGSPPRLHQAPGQPLLPSCAAAPPRLRASSRPALRPSGAPPVRPSSASTSSPPGTRPPPAIVGSGALLRACVPDRHRRIRCVPLPPSPTPRLRDSKTRVRRPLLAPNRRPGADARCTSARLCLRGCNGKIQAPSRHPGTRSTACTLHGAT